MKRFAAANHDSFASVSEGNNKIMLIYLGEESSTRIHLLEEGLRVGACWCTPLLPLHDFGEMPL
jgi:hypothetical protein